MVSRKNGRKPGTDGPKKGNRPNDFAVQPAARHATLIRFSERKNGNARSSYVLLARLRSEI